MSTTRICICAFCGQQFETNSGTKKFCNRMHYDTCIICGEQFEVPYARLSAADRSRTCSKACAKILRQRACMNKYGTTSPAGNADVQAKMQATNIERFGVAHAAQNEDIKAKMCETNQNKYGVDYYTQTKKSKQRMREKWKDAEYKESTRAKIEATCEERYGGKSSFCDKSVYAKGEDTRLEKYGAKHTWSSDELYQKSIDTLRARYDVEHPLQSDVIKQKAKQTIQDKYGVNNAMQSPVIQAKVREINLQKYGAENYMQSEEGRSRFRASMQDKYNVNTFSQTPEWKATRMKDPTKLEEFLEFDKDPTVYIDTHYPDKAPTLLELANALGVGTEAISMRAERHNCRDKIAYVYSTMEHEVYSYLQELMPNTDIQQNTHKVITPYELDLYVPEHQFAIECNPTSTHNSNINTFARDSAPTAPSYHRMKSFRCQENGIFLFHIFGYEWTHKKDIIKSMIANVLGCSTSKIYARNTEVKAVDGATAFEFLEQNHRQGGVHSKIRLGLYHNNKLVSLMTFNPMRNTIGKNIDTADCWELVRFCNILNTNVVGGASKLFKYFCKHYTPNRIRSFSDIAHTRGKLYETLGFSMIHQSGPGYVWVDSYTDVAYHRVNAQKHNIKKFLHDDSIDLSQTERDVMVAHGYLQVYDSGTILWEWCY